MKITYNGLINSVNSSLQSNLKRLQEIQQQLSSGKTINSPSNDPVKTARLNIFKSKKSQYEQFIETIETAKSWLHSTEESVNQINGLMLQIRDICIQAGNDALNQEGRNSLLLEIEQLKENMISCSNSQHLDNYIFAGLQTTRRPFSVTEEGVIYEGDSGLMIREISSESSMSINVDGKRLFNFDNTVSDDSNLFEVIDNLIQALRDNSQELISGDILEQIDRASSNIVNIYSEIGSKANRLDMTRKQHENSLTDLESRISLNEDVDIAEIIMELRKSEMVYETSLNVAGRIFPSTLLDYLKY